MNIHTKKTNLRWSYCLALIMTVFTLSCSDDESVSGSGSVEIAGTPDGFVEEGDEAKFIIRYIGDAGVDVTVDYELEGLAGPVRGTVVIPNDDRQVELVIPMPDDKILERDTMDLTFSLIGADNGVTISDGSNQKVTSFKTIDDIKTINLTSDTDFAEDVNSEGDTVFIPITISSPLDGDVSVGYSLSGSATEGIDYKVLSPNPVLLKAGDQDTLLYVRILDDKLFEDNGKFTITLDNVVVEDGSDNETVLGNSTSTFTIIDDLKIIAFERRASDTLKIEKPGDYSLKVTLSKAMDFTVGAGFSFSDMDGITLKDAVIFNKGEVERSFPFTIEEEAFKTDPTFVTVSLSELGILVPDEMDDELQLSDVNNKVVLRLEKEDD